MCVFVCSSFVCMRVCFWDFGSSPPPPPTEELYIYIYTVSFSTTLVKQDRNKQGKLDNTINIYG